MGRGLALLAVGAAGGLIARQIGVPAGMMIGALLAAGLYRLAGGESGPWRGRYGRLGRLLLGTVIGAAFGPDVLAPLQAALLPMIALIAVIVGVGLSLGWALGRWTPLDARSALISGVPGGLPAMAALAEALDADATVVAAIHFSRLTTILVMAPVLIPLLATTDGTIAPSAAGVPSAELGVVGLLGLVVALAVGLAGGGLAVCGGVPTGDLIGSILAVGGANLVGVGLGPLSGDFRQAAVLLIGTAVGAQVSRESLGRLRKVTLPVAAFIVAIIGVGLLLGWGLAQATPLDLATALLSAVPGGASTMPAVAHDLGGDMRLVAALHLTRQLIVLIVVPVVLGRVVKTRNARMESRITRMDE